MFTGIIQAVGTVVAMQPSGGDLRLRVHSGKLPLADVALGDSICTNGVCLTVIELPGDGYWADVSVETLNFTTLGKLGPGARVNLEKALTPASRLGGHIVSGHVDGTAVIEEMHDEGDSTRITLRAPRELARFIAPKGSVALNGTSLTVNEVDGERFGVNVIPHTQEVTTWGAVKVGDRVNLEIDTLARYVARLAEAG